MDVVARLRFARITPRKARLVAETIRGLSLPSAQVRLRVLPQRAAPLLLKLLNSAAANAQHNFRLEPAHLVVKRVLVNEGPRLKRIRPRSRGVAGRIVKRTSHIEIVLASEGIVPASAGARKPAAIETRKAEELSPEELRAATEVSVRARPEDTTGAVKRAAPPRGVRRLLERKHGEGS